MESCISGKSFIILTCVSIEHNIIHIEIWHIIVTPGPSDLYVTVLNFNTYIKCQHESLVCLILKALNMNWAHCRGKLQSSVLNKSLSLKFTEPKVDSKRELRKSLYNEHFKRKCSSVSICISIKVFLKLTLIHPRFRKLLGNCECMKLY